MQRRSLEETYRRYSQSRRKQRSWAAENPGNVAIRTELLASLLELAGGRPTADGEALDIGCGGGWLLEELARAGADEERLHGVDLIEARVDAARSRLPGADIRRADARALPFEDGRFELVTLLTALSSMPPETIGAAIAEAGRVVSDDGVVICYEPRLPNPFNRATVTVSEAELTASLGQLVTVVRLTGFPPVARRLGRMTPRLYPTLSKAVPTHRLTAH